MPRRIVGGRHSPYHRNDSRNLMTLRDFLYPADAVSPTARLRQVTLWVIWRKARQELITALDTVEGIYGGIVHAPLFALMRLIAACGGSFAALGREPLDARDLRHHAFALLSRGGQQEPRDRVGIGRRVGYRPPDHATAVRPLPRRPGKMRADLLSGFVVEFGVGTGECPT